MIVKCSDQNAFLAQKNQPICLDSVEGIHYFPPRSVLLLIILLQKLSGKASSDEFAVHDDLQYSRIV
jgi:hypothetical protein